MYTICFQSDLAKTKEEALENLFKLAKARENSPILDEYEMTCESKGATTEEIKEVYRKAYKEYDDEFKACICGNDDDGPCRCS